MMYLDPRIIDTPVLYNVFFTETATTAEASLGSSVYYVDEYGELRLRREPERCPHCGEIIDQCCGGCLDWLLGKAMAEE